MLIYHLRTLFNSPLTFYYQLRNKINNQYLWQKYLNKCRKYEKPIFILSFDCDTKKDIEVVTEVHKKLLNKKITPIYAVPGELLEKGEEVYKYIFSTGSEFINHGYKKHTNLQKDNTYKSFFFYDKITPNELVEDIEKGDETIKKVLQFKPQGFRTPHFGTFVKKEQLDLLYKTINRLNYSFSTSTTPIFSINKGPVYKSKNIYEVPITGCIDFPLTILDSWSFRFAEGRQFNEQDYLNQLEKLLLTCEKKIPLVINIYADPSQVYDWDDWFSMISKFSPYNMKSYKELIKKVAV